MVPRLEQELLTLPEHPSSLPVFSGVRVTRYLVLCVCVVDLCMSFCTFSIVLSVLLQFTDSDYPFGIFKLFLQYAGNQSTGFFSYQRNESQTLPLVSSNSFHPSGAPQLIPNKLFITLLLSYLKQSNLRPTKSASERYNLVQLRSKHNISFI